MMIRANCLGAVAAVVLMLASGCSGSSNSSNSSTPAPAPVATAAASLAQPAPVPADLKCAGAIVWVNMSSKIYHMAGDRYYGRTKHGKYLCQTDAEAQGYHMAGMPRRHTAANPTPTST